MGGALSGATPSPRGPRHCPQFAAELTALPGPISVNTKMKPIEVRNDIQNRMKCASDL